MVQEVMENVFVAPESNQIVHEHRLGRIIAEDTWLGFRRTEDLVIIQVTQQGRTVDQKRTLYARLVDPAIDSKEQKSFRFKSQGQLVELGSRFAVNDAFGVKFSGWLAALFWETMCLIKLDSQQNRVRQVCDWALELSNVPQ